MSYIILPCKNQGKYAGKVQKCMKIITYLLQEGIFLHKVKCDRRESLFVKTSLGLD